LDIYLPKTGTAPYPVIIAVHGGAFKFGSKTGSDIAAMFRWLEKGYAVVSVDYRLSSEAVFPAAIDDVQAAIMFIKKNAQTYELNPNKIALWWDSAGWNLVSLAGTKGNTADNSQVQAVVDWFGPIYFSRMDDQFSKLWVTGAMGKTNSESSAESLYIWKTIGTPEAESLVKMASPETFISKNSPPFFIQHGTADKNIPITQSEEFAAKLAESIWKDKVVFEKIEWAAHGWDLFESDENLAKIFAFLEKYLK
jgi:acetyl esterase/lipase